MCDQPAVCILFQSIQDCIQEIVGFLQLVIKQGIVLGQLKSFQIAVLHYLKTHAV